jgi:hypothetical protein
MHTRGACSTCLACSAQLGLHSLEHAAGQQAAWHPRQRQLGWVALSQFECHLVSAMIGL